MNNFAVKSTKCGKSLWSVYEGLAFQSTPPRGRRRIMLAPADVEGVFQSTPPRGRRQNLLPKRHEPGKFQSTPPRGRRRTTPSCHCRRRRDFNPRLREGGDNRRQPAVRYPAYFNPRLREEGDLEIHREIGLQHHFNPRLREEGDEHLEAFGIASDISIHASAREATATA